MRNMKLLMTLTLIGLSTACTASTRDKMNKTMNPMADMTNTPRDAGIDHLAQSVCDAYQDHEGFGASHKYATRAECVADSTTSFQKKYTAEACGAPHAFITEKLDMCIARARNWEASTNVFDIAGFMTSCSAMQICH